MTVNTPPRADHALVDWIVIPDGEGESRVRLPHDAMLAAGRSPSASGGSESAWFVGGAYTYRTQWTAPEDSGSIASLVFEGVQGDAVVVVNGHRVGTVRSGYIEFEIAITHAIVWDMVNDIEVHVDHRDQPAERWYPGSGLYRPVTLALRPPAHFSRDAVRVVTRQLDGRQARVDVDVRLSGKAPAGTTVDIVLSSEGQPVARGSFVGEAGAVELDVTDPRPWSVEEPFRYELEVTAVAGEKTLDTWHSPVGLRTIEVDARRGLRINGREVLLAGACIHHDNGLLGAATHRAAEFRRIRLLKKAGFNAIRSAHNPLSRHLLDACDELGMYVLDELADYWFVRKTAYDHSGGFRQTWRDDADAMVAKDRNYACVIMYASGNEIPESATPEGVELSRQITDHLHRVDHARPVTLAVNLFLNTLVSMNASPYKADEATDEPAMAGSTEANVMINHIGKLMSLVSRLPRADRASRDAFGTVDIAGYNYGLARYPGDVRRHPHRVILGSETLPGDVARAWASVKKYPAVIGDFVWAGWEYLGEAGVAVWVPGKKAGLAKPYPYLIAGPGMFDITGRPDASLRLAQAAWGVLDAPVITVRPLDRSGKPYVRSAWRVTDAVESWAWRGREGTRAEIEVYSAEEQIELVLNGRSLGRKRAGRRAGYRARFTVAYAPGALVAIAYRGRREVGRSELRSAGSATLRLSPETDVLVADGADLAFVQLELADQNGVVEMLDDDRVQISVEGPAELVGFGTAAPATEDSFLSPSCTTYRGRALAILRSTGGAGIVGVTATSRAHGTETVHLLAVPVPEPVLPLTRA